MTPEEVQKLITQMTGIESSMTLFQDKASAELEKTGEVTAKTQASIDNLGIQQKDFADRLLSIEQSGAGGGGEPTGSPSIGAQFTGSDVYATFKDGQSQKARFEIENSTTTGSDITVAPDRKAQIVPGATETLTIEDAITSIPTSSNAIEYTREATFVNNAAEVAEGNQKPQTDITFSLENEKVVTVAHWTKISRQLADDAPALAAYINFRMRYGVDQRVETQLVVGDGAGANMKGLMAPGNFTAHGIPNADLGSVLKKHVLIRKVVAQLKISGYMADTILLNPIDAADMEIAEGTTANVKGVSLGAPIVESNGIAQDTFLVGALRQAATLHNRQSTVIELSESDGDNFTKNLVTIRAERRMALTVEVPAAMQGGDLTPA
ncbi:phage major capsid protein [Pseudomonadota bacterium]|nr:phage major capsid protein [Pseudomonadota bacterium]